MKVKRLKKGKFIEQFTNKNAESIDATLQIFHGLPNHP